MSGSVNKVILIGNLGRDPEVRNFSNGGKVCNLRIATTETWKKDGERKERTEWHSVSILSDGIVRVAEQHLRKGSKVYIEGQLETRKWQDQSGQDRYTTEVVLRPYSSTLTMLDSPRSNDDDLSADGPFNPGYASKGMQGIGGGLGGGDMGDEISFAPEWRA